MSGNMWSIERLRMSTVGGETIKYWVRDREQHLTAHVATLYIPLHYGLDYRLVNLETGELFSVEEKDDPADSDYVIFTIGEKINV